MTLKDKTARFPESNWKPGGFYYSSYAEITAVMHSASGNAHQTCSVP